MKPNENLSPLLLHAASSHLKEATPYLFSRSLAPLYLQHNLQNTGTLFICTQVLSDGYGDYLALLKAGWTLRKNNPTLKIELVYTYSTLLPVVDTQGLTVHAFLESPDRPILEPILEGKKAEELSAESILAEALYERMKKSVAILHIALALNTFDNPLLAEKSLYFAEAGNFLGYENSQKYNWYSLGLGPLEEGVFLESSTYTRRDDRSRYFAYFSKDSKQSQTFTSLAALLSGKSSHQVIRPEKALPYQEFQRLMAESAPLVGCTGDGSLAECLALGKIPYYEMRPHKTKTLESLVRLTRFLGLKNVDDYFMSMGQIELEPSQELYEILSRDSFMPEWEKLITFIHKYCKLEESLTARVRRIVLNMGAIEQALAKDIQNGSETFESATLKIQNHLNQS